MPQKVAPKTIPCYCSTGEYVLEEEACQVIVKELQISEEKAHKVVKTISKRQDGKIAKSDLEMIQYGINQA